MPEITGFDRKLIETTMHRAHIPGVSIAYSDAKAKTLSTTTIGTTDTRDTSMVRDVQDDTVFGAASLSKPVFAYLVLKLIDKGVLKDSHGRAIGLDTPLYDSLSLDTFFHEHGKALSDKDIVSAKTITPRMLLSHTSGLGIDASAVLNFAPGTEFAYSGMGLMYLQKVIEVETGKLLEDLAQEHVFGESALSMKHSTFIPPGIPKANAANSLYTTSSDYAKLMTAWVQDRSPLMQQAFITQVSLTQDNQRFPGEQKSTTEHVDPKTKERLAWGLGMCLELDETGQAVKAFHFGDMNQFRAQMAVDLKKKSCIVYFSNAHKDLEANGHVLGPLIITPKIPVNNAHAWFYTKFRFALNIEQLTEGSRFGIIAEDQDKQAHSEAVIAALRPEGTLTSAPNLQETKVVHDAKSSRAGLESSHAMMRGLMPTNSPMPTPIFNETKKQPNEQFSQTTIIEEESPTEADKLPSPFPSPIKMTPKGPNDF